MTNIIPLKKRPDRVLRLLLLLIAVLILALAIAYWTQRATIPTKIHPGAVQVVDGDTIRTNGLVYRLVGFDAPETYDAKCPQERALGERAAARLKMIVDRGNPDLTEAATGKALSGPDSFSCTNGAPGNGFSACNLDQL